MEPAAPVASSVDQPALIPLPDAPLLERHLAISTFVESAVNQRASACLAERGFAESLPAVVADPPGVLLRRYGVVKMKDAQRYGYAWPGEDSAAEPPPLSAAALTAAFGERPMIEETVEWRQRQVGGVSVPGGCLGTAWVEFFGSPQAAIEYQRTMFVVEQVRREASKSADASPERLRLDDEWKGCLSKGGWKPDRTPAETAGRDWKRSATATPVAAELAMAIADVKCKEAVQYVARATEQLSAAETAALREFPDVVARLEAVEAKLAAG